MDPDREACREREEPKLVHSQAEFDQAVKAGQRRFILVSPSDRWHQPIEFQLSPLEKAWVYELQLCSAALVMSSGRASLSGYGLVRLFGDAKAFAEDALDVSCEDFTNLIARQRVTVRAGGDSRVAAYGYTRVHAVTRARVAATGCAIVEAQGNAKVCARGWATVCTSSSEKTEVYDEAVVRVLNAPDANLQVGPAGVVLVQDSPVVSQLWTFLGSGLRKHPRCTTVKDWCERNGVVVEDGVAVLYKAVYDTFHSPHGMVKNVCYRPGTATEALDWDNGEDELGCGLHFAASPAEALTFFPDATNFVACRVHLADLVYQEQPEYPNKIKGRFCWNWYECDLFGELLGEKMEPPANLIRDLRHWATDKEATSES